MEDIYISSYVTAFTFKSYVILCNRIIFFHFTIQCELYKLQNIKYEQYYS